jgi:hypothetical protein
MCKSSSQWHPVVEKEKIASAHSPVRLSLAKPF